MHADIFNMIVDRVNLPVIVAPGLYTVILEKDARFYVHTVTSSQETATATLQTLSECDRAFVLTRRKGQRGYDIVAGSAPAFPR